ncbi:pilus assembly FimT family protein [Planctomicrobium sp. SH527]|uniref:pilus assembly FimT family protein n=1 Tax=Planctomicrobium sp. SH527 TaxID=3448123 RepID=UPI003F5B84F0
MKTRLSQPDHKRLHRTAFTLVELLVAMTIFVILATITVTGFRGSDSDRVSNAAAAFKNALEGAKSRAVKSGETRGLRLILSPTNGREVTSLVYVDGGRYESGELRFEFNNTMTINRWQVQSTNPALWNTLRTQSLIGPGTRFQTTESGEWFTLVAEVIPNDPASWWYIDHAPANAIAANPALPPESTVGSGWRLEPSDLDDLATPSTYGVSTAVASAPRPYRIQIAPMILAGAEPISLPPNTCIDLDGSKVPYGWRPNPAATPAKPNYGPSIPGSAESRPIDILFTPKGTVARPLTTEGILHFRVASTIDLGLWNTATTKPAAPNSTTRTNPVVAIDPERGGKLVSVMTQTGSLVNADIYPSKPVGTAYNQVGYDFNDTADTGNTAYRSPYTFILYGKESK